MQTIMKVALTGKQIGWRKDVVNELKIGDMMMTLRPSLMILLKKLPTLGSTELSQLDLWS